MIGGIGGTGADIVQKSPKLVPISIKFAGQWNLQLWEGWSRRSQQSNLCLKGRSLRLQGGYVRLQVLDSIRQFRWGLSRVSANAESRWPQFEGFSMCQLTRMSAVLPSDWSGQKA